MLLSSQSVLPGQNKRTAQQPALRRRQSILKFQVRVQQTSNINSRGPQQGSHSALQARLDSFTPWLQPHSSRNTDSPVAATGGGNEPPSEPPKPPVGPEDDYDPDDEDIIDLTEAEKIAERAGMELPEDFVEAAKGEGLRQSVLETWIKLQKNWLTRFICNASKFFRDRLLFDPRFLFIVGAEICIDMACATIAEVRKRGEDFWAEFEFYLSDLLVGLVLDILLVGLMATPAVIGKHHAAHNASGLQKLLARTPKAVFEPNTAGEPKYTKFQRLFCLVVKFGEYSLAGIVCGIVGQALANSLVTAKRAVLKPDMRKEQPNPPIILTGLTWGLFMGISSNIRYQSIFAVERLTDKTIAKSVPKAPYIVSFILRLINNIWGGENFIDHARWTGIQPATED